MIRNPGIFVEEKFRGMQLRGRQSSESTDWAHYGQSMRILSISWYYWKKQCGDKNMMPMTVSLEAWLEWNFCANDLLRELFQEKGSEESRMAGES